MSTIQNGHDDHKLARKHLTRSQSSQRRNYFPNEQPTRPFTVPGTNAFVAQRVAGNRQPLARALAAREPTATLTADR